MNSFSRLLALVALVLGLAVCQVNSAAAQTLLTEDFTKDLSSSSSGVGNWLFFNGACLTAGTSTNLTSPAASIPACTAVLNSYYINTQDHDQYLMGGANGFLGGTSAPSSPSGQQADPVGLGALRFTNGRPYGNQQRGAIVSTNAYSTSSGIQVTFKTVTYGGTGADGISFYLMDGCVPVSGAIMPSGCSSTAISPVGGPNVPAIGATGGSLAYTCSNTNGPGSGTGVTYDGLTGGYLGLGIDEYGNFLNQGDNTSSGYGFHAGRIGLRGAGAISWPALNNAYGVNPSDSTKPFYPAWLAATCGSGTFDTTLSGGPACGTCPAIASTNSTTGGVTTATSTVSTYGVGGICTNVTTTTTTTANCNSGYTYDSAAVPTICGKCSSGTYSPTSSGTYPNGYCFKSIILPGGTCASGFSKDNTLMLCTTTSGSKLSTQTPLNTGTAGVVTGTSTTTTTATSSAYTVNTTAIQNAMQKTCSSGHLWNYASTTPTDAGTATLPTDPSSPNVKNTAKILDYAPIPSAYTVLPVGNPLYNGSATTRAAATTIFYNLKITSDGFLSLSYAYNGGAYQSVIANQNINSSNGAPPSFVRFGFAGSTGGATNVHEIMCFKSTPAVTTGSSAGVNEKQTAKVEAGTFAYFAFYDPNNWVGSVTANALYTDTTTGNVAITTVPAWDATCVLTGVASGKTCSTNVAGPTPAQDPASRTILTYNGTVGKPFEWSGLSTAQQNALTTGDPSSSQYRLNYLRGDRSNEITTAGTCTYMSSSPCFRARTGLIADIVDSSPTWVGPPQANYTATWLDKLYPATPMAENSGSQSYQQYIVAQQTRPNIVYVGSNDGMLHGLRSGANDSSGNFTTTTTPNDGQEVIAYVPGSLLLSPSTGGACGSLSSTGSTTQNIHGLTPAFTPSSGPVQAACITPALDYSGVQYGHNFYVDATPGTGDLYYSGAWHTWLVSGLGAGGATIFALDVTNPTATNFSESNAGSLVIGEWTPSSITCESNTTCGTNLGNTYGTPLVRRLHDGRWAVIFGNGWGSSSGDAGIYVMTVDNSGNKLFYYISTGNTGTANNNGIAYVAAADLDGDHITDYIYAGDLMGNLWKFDLTSATEASWAVSQGPIFTAASGQPITSQVTATNGTTTAGNNTLVVTFGTGKRIQFTNTAQPQFQSATQSMYGVWDWNMTSWNSKSSVQFTSLTTTASGLTAPYTLTKSKLQQQVLTLNADGSTRDMLTPNSICWAQSTGCTSTAAQFGWYIDLIGTQEQIIYNPLQLAGVYIVNSIVPANNQPTSCSTSNDTGVTYAISTLTGAPPTNGTSSANFFSQIHSPASGFHDSSAAGAQLNAVGTMYFVTSGTGSTSGVYEDTNGDKHATPFQLPGVGKGKRLTWVQLR